MFHSWHAFVSRLPKSNQSRHGRARAGGCAEEQGSGGHLAPLSRGSQRCGSAGGSVPGVVRDEPVAERPRWAHNSWKERENQNKAARGEPLKREGGPGARRPREARVSKRGLSAFQPPPGRCRYRVSTRAAGPRRSSGPGRGQRRPLPRLGWAGPGRAASGLQGEASGSESERPPGPSRFSSALGQPYNLLLLRACSLLLPFFFFFSPSFSDLFFSLCFLLCLFSLSASPLFPLCFASSSLFSLTPLVFLRSQDICFNLCSMKSMSLTVLY